MPRVCCVIGCQRVRRLPYPSTFRIPRNSKRRAAWLKALPNPPKSDSCCEAHFERKYFAKRALNKNAKSPQKTTRRKGLTPDAVPTLFDDVKIPMKKEIQRLLKSTEFMDTGTNVGGINDIVTTFTELQNEMQFRLNLKSFQVQICPNEIYLFDLRLCPTKCVVVRTSVVISNDKNVTIYFNGMPQKLRAVTGIFGGNFRLVLYSQLQKLIDKYSDIADPVPEARADGPPAKQVTDTDAVSDKPIEILRKEAVECVRKLQVAVGKNKNYNNELDFIIDQIRLSVQSTQVKQWKHTMPTIFYAYLMYCHMGNDNYVVLRNQFKLTLPLSSTMHLLATLDDSPPPLPLRHKSSYLSGSVAKLQSPHHKLMNIEIKELYYNGRLCVKATNANCQAKAILCFMLTSIFGTFKKIVYFEPVNNILGAGLTDITMKVIEKVHRLNVQVFSITADLNSATKSMFAQLMAFGANAEENATNYRFDNAAFAGEYIYLLYNPASVLHSLRNNWIDQRDSQKSLVYPNFDTGTRCTACFRHIHELFESEADMLIRTATKLDRETVYPNSNERELFALTLNIFDMSTIVGLRTASGGYSATVDLLNLINMWWNIMDIGKSKAIGSIYDDNLMLLPSIIEWARKWHTMDVEYDQSAEVIGRLSIETYEAFIQTTKVIAALAKTLILERRITTGFQPGKFHTEDFEPLFSKFKKLRKID